jgi:hypothetical protein
MDSKLMDRVDELRRVDARLVELRKISKRLHHLGEVNCNVGLSIQQEKSEDKLEKRAEEIAFSLGVKFYYQRDPRGCAVFLVPIEWDDEYTASNYSSGLAIY